MHGCCGNVGAQGASMRRQRLRSIIRRRYEKGAILLASRRVGRGVWGSCGGHRSPPSPSHVITIHGDSYRLKEKRRSGLLQKPTAAETKSEIKSVSAARSIMDRYSELRRDVKK